MISLIFSCRTAKDEHKPDENDLFLPMNHLKDSEGKLLELFAHHTVHVETL